MLKSIAFQSNQSGISEGFKIFLLPHYSAILLKSFISQYLNILRNFQGLKSLPQNTVRFGHKQMSDYHNPTFLSHDPTFLRGNPIFLRSHPIIPCRCAIFPRSYHILHYVYPILHRRDPTFPRRYAIFHHRNSISHSRNPIFPRNDPTLHSCNPILHKSSSASGRSYKILG